MTNMLKPKINQQAQTPPPPSAEAKAPVRELGDERRDAQKLKQKGRSSLRIDPQTGGSGASRTGINVPMK